MRKYLTAYNLLLAFVVALCISTIAAPISMALGLEEIAKIIYFIFSFFCHQIHYRSLHIFDYQYAWCTRDTFIWLSILASGIFVKLYGFKGLKLYQIILFVIPIGLDGGIQFIATFFGLADDSSNLIYASTNFTRMLTGSILGIGIGLWVFPTLREVEMGMQNKIEKLKWGVLKTSAVLLLIMFIIYMGLIGLWYFTSENYRPLNIVDHAVRFPEDKDEWFIRRKHATCPVDARQGGFIQLNCDEEDKN